MAQDPISPVQRLTDAFQARFGSTKGMRVVQAPGRVNLMGDHTDYNDGLVLPMTIDRAVYVALRPRQDRIVHFYALNYAEDAQRDLDAPFESPDTHWAHYVMGVVEETAQRGFLPHGLEGIIYGDVPLGAGLSSSAALEVAVLLALQTLFDFPLDAIAGIKLCQQVEHHYVGLQCGIMDQFASRLGRKDHALFLDCKTLDYAAIPLHLDHTHIIIVDSGVSRELASSKYNERRAECEQAVRYFQGLDDRIQTLREVSPALFDAHQQRLPSIPRQRCAHVLSENARVEASSQALTDGDLRRFGALMNDSHASLRDQYEVSVPAVDFLVALAQNTEGVLGARMTGAGFGGCTVNLIEEHAIPAFMEQVETSYQQAFQKVSTIYVVGDNLEAGVLL